MHVSIHSLTQTIYDGEAQSINCKTVSGEITILNHHHPLITLLDKGVIAVTTTRGEIKYINVTSGFVEVQKNRTNIIAEEA